MKPSSNGRLRSLLQPSNLIAVVALVAALGGTAFAAARITGKHVKDNSLTGRDIRNHSLTKKDFKGKLRGPRGPAGVNGQSGATGPTGPSGTTGAAGATNVTIRIGSPVSFSGANPGNVSASCAAGERAVGGGINVAGETDGNVTGAARLVESYPTPATAGATATGWAGAVTYTGAGTDSASAYVVCASP
jgi:hypothetical protein